MRIARLLVVLTLMAGIWGCATEKVKLPASPELPAATGEAKISKDKNGNTLLRLKVEHFAPPQKLQPPKPVYVVWLETSNHEMHNIGELKIDDDLQGKLETVTPYAVFQIVITAEDYATVTFPSPQVVLRTRVIASD
jgi:hypothetical protein